MTVSNVDKRWSLPSSWVWARFGEIADIRSDLVEPSLFSSLPHIAPNHIESGTGHLLPYLTVAEDKVISAKHRFFPGQILYSKIRPYLAKAVRVNFPGLCSADMYPISARIEPAYLHRWILTREFTSAASGHQGRTVLPKINQEALVTVPVPLAPQMEQVRISKKLETLLSASARTKKTLDAVPTLLDRLRQSILAAAFRGDLTADWRARNPDVEPADKLLEKIRAERRRRWEAAELARLTAKGKPPTDDRWKDRYSAPTAVEDFALPVLPTGWTWASAEECAHEITVGYVGPMKDEYISEGVPFLRSQNVRENRFDNKDIKYVSRDFHKRISKSSLAPGDVVVVRSGAPGTACVIPRELGEANCSDLVIVRPGSFVGPWFLSYFLNSKFARLRVLDLQVGVAQQHFNVGAMKTLPLPIAPLSEQRLVIELLRQAFSAIAKIEDGLQSMTQMHASLESSVLAKAFRGELVPQDPNDEPASVLLERLRAEAAAAPAKPGRRARAAASEPGPAAPIASSPQARPAPAPVAARRASPPESTPPPARPTPPTPAPPGAQPTLPGIPSGDFLEHPADRQVAQVHALLLGEGPLPREDAVRRAAELLRDAGLASFQRLRKDGTLATCIDAAIAVGLRQGSFDRPSPGHVRALAKSPEDVPPALWRRALLAALAEPETDADAAVRDAAAWSQAQFGLEFQRLRTGGRIDTALRAALAEMLASREIVSDRHGILSPGPRRS